ncbi:hypothetical protein BpHYR1_002928 [Brachionus plicatilis]|uniref:Uncharacterized protein n=1 Tax=Brachionus plicatilis TaxID=10195 RepID=A0A3M7RBG7_BRAPC|nr:hypothetical protein BpHYR1_002928 [Brachionus plicatilis]
MTKNGRLLTRKYLKWREAESAKVLQLMSQQKSKNSKKKSEKLKTDFESRSVVIFVFHLFHLKQHPATTTTKAPFLKASKL